VSGIKYLKTGITREILCKWWWTFRFLIIRDFLRNKFLSHSPNDTYEAGKWNCETNEVTSMLKVVSIQDAGVQHKAAISSNIYKENCYSLCCRVLGFCAEYSISSSAFEISTVDYCDVQQNKLSWFYEVYKKAALTGSWRFIIRMTRVQ